MSETQLMLKLPYFQFNKIHSDVAHHRDDLQKHVHDFLRKIAKELASKIEGRASKIAKAYGYTDDDLANDLDAIDWSPLAEDAGKDLAQIALAYAKRGLTQLGTNDEALFTVVNQRARDFALERGAELVGMKYDENGDLVDNPDAEWAIDDTTRAELKEIVTEAMEEETSMKELAQRVLDAGSFTQSRANMIAVTEASRAQAQGSLAAWDESGLVEGVSVMLSFDHDSDDECDDVADGSPYPIEEALDLVPVHPNCECTVVATKIRGGFEAKVDKRRTRHAVN